MPADDQAAVALTGPGLTGAAGHPSVIDVYQHYGASWAALRSAELVEAGWLDRLRALLLPDGSVLDLGSGSGLPLAGELVRRGQAVLGVDAATTMLALFRRDLPGVEAIRADMRALALGRRFAELLAWDSVFHLSPADQRGMFARVQAHAQAQLPVGDHGLRLVGNSGPRTFIRSAG